MKSLKAIVNWGTSIIIAFLIAGCINVFIFQTCKVEGHSMDPTLYDQELLLVSKLISTFSYEPEYNDIVIIDSLTKKKKSFKDKLLNSSLIAYFTGDTNEHIYVKRVIGKSGDTIEFKNGHLYRNDKKIQESYIKEPMNPFIENKWIVPYNHIFVLGDNRNYSEDSRAIGFIPIDNILGTKIL